MDLAMTVGGWAMLAASRPSWGFWDESWAFPGVDPPLHLTRTEALAPPPTLWPYVSLWGNGD